MDKWLIVQLEIRLLTIWASTLGSLTTAGYIDYRRNLNPFLILIKINSAYPRPKYKS